MAIFGNRNPSPAPAAPEPPPANPLAATPDPGVSRSEFDAKFSEMLGAIQQLAERPVIVQTGAPAPQAPPPPPEITDDEINQAFAEGNGAARVKEMVRRQIDAAASTVRSEVAAIQNYGATALGSHAERLFVTSLDKEDRATFQTYEKEIRGMLSQVEPQLRGMPETWETCFNAVVGSHRKEIEAVRLEAALRQRAAEEDAARQAPQPGTRSGGRSLPSDDGDVPTVQDFVGHMQEFQDLSEDDFIRKINRGKPAGQRYKDWNDYIARGKAIDRELRAIRDGDENAA